MWKGENVVPAVKYNYDYYSENIRSNKGVAKNARPKLASSKMSAQRKVSSNKANISSKHNTLNTSNTQKKKQNRVSVDAPITAKKKIIISGSMSRRR